MFMLPLNSKIWQLTKQSNLFNSVRFYFCYIFWCKFPMYTYCPWNLSSAFFGISRSSSPLKKKNP